MPTEQQTFDGAKVIQRSLLSEVRRLSAALNAFPKGAMGLTPDEVKASPEFRLAKSQYEAAFQKLRRFNAILNKNGASARAEGRER